MPSFFRRFRGRVNSVCPVARSPRDALARSQYPNRQDSDRMLRHDVSLAIPFTVRCSSNGGTVTRAPPTRPKSFFFFRYTDPTSHHRCSNRNYRQQWDVLNSAKSRILEILYAQHTPAGVRIAAIKFMQKVILVQTRGATDPRVRPPPSGTAGSPVNGLIMI
jgi:hypothetical protein